MQLYHDLNVENVDLSSYSQVVLTAVNHRGQALLHYAARFGDNNLLTKLLQTGYFNVDATDVKGYTAADYSIKGQQTTALGILVKNGATISGYVNKHNAGSEEFVNQANLFTDAITALSVSDINPNGTDLSGVSAEYSETCE